MGDSTGESTPTADCVRVRAVVHGRVQGVGFRYHAYEQARRLGVTGYVRNKWDGTVEVVAEGRRGALDLFLSWLQQGPRAAHVTHVDVRWPSLGDAPPRQYGTFEVRF